MRRAFHLQLERLPEGIHDPLWSRTMPSCNGPTVLMDFRRSRVSPWIDVSLLCDHCHRELRALDTRNALASGWSTPAHLSTDRPVHFPSVLNRAKATKSPPPTAFFTKMNTLTIHIYTTSTTPLHTQSKHIHFYTAPPAV